jgi:hypothetical protein
MEIEDPKSGKTYWYNSKTQQTSQTNPEAAAGNEAHQEAICCDTMRRCDVDAS